MYERSIHLGGGEGNPVIRVVYPLGRCLPKGLSDALTPAMISSEPLAPRDYSLLSLRQGIKGMGSLPCLDEGSDTEDLRELLDAIN